MAHMHRAPTGGPAGVPSSAQRPVRIPLRSGTGSGGGPSGAAAQRHTRGSQSAARASGPRAPPSSPVAARRAQPEPELPRVETQADADRVLHVLMAAKIQRSKKAEESKELLQRIELCKRALVPYMQAHSLDKLDDDVHGHRLKIGVKKRKRQLKWQDVIELIRQDHGNEVAARYHQRMLDMAQTGELRHEAKITQLGLRKRGESAGGAASAK